MRILLLGGNRFFGKHAALTLFKEGHDLTFITRGNLPLDPILLRGTAESPPVTWFKTDRDQMDLDTQKKIIQKPYDIVIDQSCYTAAQARRVCEWLMPHTKRLIFTSTLCVYGRGFQMPETLFDPWVYHFSKDVSKEEDYGEGKRQAETIFARALDPQKWVALRLPIVLGPDDYTLRLKRYIECVRDGVPLFFTAPKSRISFIHVLDAAQGLVELCKRPEITGPLNWAAPDAISLDELLGEIEARVKKKAILTDDPKLSGTREYDLDQDWVIDVKRAGEFGMKAAPIRSWIGNLIEELKR